jgi:hypothetical protein
MPLEEVNETYETKMAGFEVDCADGKGEATACHYVAEFYATIKEQHERAAALFEKNCREKGFGPSCLSLGRYYRTSLWSIKNNRLHSKQSCNCYCHSEREGRGAE